MPRAGLTGAAVVERAARLLDERPGEPLALAPLAEALGVRPPSLYKHVDGLAGLRRGVMVHAKAELADELGRAAVGRARREAVEGIARAYRAWALAHPARYRLTTAPPVVGDDEDVAVSGRLLGIVTDALAGYGVDGDDAVDAARFLRSALHGFVALESEGAFRLDADLDRSFARVVAGVDAALGG